MANVPFFRALSRRWRPIVRKVPPPSEATEAGSAAAKSTNGRAARPAWTPWLWVDN
jgi:hypothetical protein